jgi:carbonic anhydrase/acetyltransferase-like protein (isoleucine patch superfamily)
MLPGAVEDGHPTTRGDIHVGNDVWIGHGATILSGVSIGDGVVVGARAVVSSNVRPYAIVAGNPARELRRRFSDASVEKLRRLKWWDWPDTVVEDAIDLLCAGDVVALERFAESCEPFA